MPRARARAKAAINTYRNKNVIFFSLLFSFAFFLGGYMFSETPGGRETDLRGGTWWVGIFFLACGMDRMGW